MIPEIGLSQGKRESEELYDSQNEIGLEQTGINIVEWFQVDKSLV